MSTLTAAQAEQLRRAYRLPPPIWFRSTCNGERVTLASLERRGFLVRRAWRGDGIDRGSAFEYRLAPSVREAADRVRQSRAVTA